MGKEREYKILISGYYGFGNAGDEAILTALVQQLKTEIPNVRITVLSNSPPQTAEEHEVKSVDRMNSWQVLKAIADTHVLISGGGGLVQDVTGYKTVIYYLGLIQAAKIMGKKVMVLANGLGPLTLKKSRRLARMILNQADYITYRDEKSKRLSDETGIKKPPVEVTADPVFSLKPAESSIVDEISLKEGIERDRFNLGISVRPWKTRNDYIRMLAELADSYVEENNAGVYLFPFQESQDLETCKKLAELMTKPAKIVSRTYSIPEMMGLMGRMDMLVGMRLHSLIFSLVQNVPSLGISYDPKVANLMDMLEMPCLPVDEFTREELFNDTANIYLNRGPIREYLPDRIGLLQDEALRNIRILKKLMKIGYKGG